MARAFWATALVPLCLAACQAPGSTWALDGGADLAPAPHPIEPATPCGEPASLPPGVRLDVGHPKQPMIVGRNADRLLSMDVDTPLPADRRRWILWDLTTATQLASGAGQEASFSPSLFLVRTIAQAELYSTTDGQLLATLDAQGTRVGLATDGSYVWTTSATALTVLSPTGTPLVTVAGDYSSARVYANPDAVSVLHLVADTYVVERIALPAGTLTQLSVPGPLPELFSDGHHYATSSNGVWTIFDDAGAIVATTTEPILDGLGTVVWGNSVDGLHLGRVENGQVTRIRTEEGGSPQVNGNVLALWGAHDLTLVRLDTDGLEETATPLTVATGSISTVAIDRQGRWAIADERGMVWAAGTGTDPNAVERLGCGQPRDVAGSPSGRSALATPTGVHVFDAVGRHEGVIEGDAVHLALSDDGSAIVVETAAGLEVHAWPGGTLVSSLPTPATVGRPDWPPTLRAWSFATTRGLLSRNTGSWQNPGWWDITRSISDLSGTTLEEDASDSLWFLSPGGNRVEVSVLDGTTQVVCWEFKTRFFDAHGLYSTSITARPLLWLDEDRVLAQDCPSGRTAIFDAAGHVLGAVSVPAILRPRPAGPNLLYDAQFNFVWNVTTGAQAWSSALPFDGPGLGAVAGSTVVFSSAGRLYGSPLGPSP